MKLDNLLPVKNLRFEIPLSPVSGLENRGIILTKTKAECILMLIVMATSSSYLLTKLGSNNIAAFNLIALRFGIAFAVTSLLCLKRILRVNRKTMAISTLLGVLLFLLLTAQIYGLTTVSTSGGSFLSSTTVVFVPVLQAILHKKLPHMRILVGVAVTMVGISLMTITSDFTITTGALLYILSAILYTFHIIIADYYAYEIDILAVGILELCVGGLLAFCFSLLLETPRFPQNPTEWYVTLALGLLCSAFGMALQPAVQRHTTPERYGLIFGLGPVFSALLGAVFLKESLGICGLIGAVLVMSGILFTGWQKKFQK